jgi:phosphoglucosamine mutase
VGDRHVADAMAARGLVLGGEQSGHLVFRREATTGDGLLTGVKLLQLVERKGRSLAELVEGAMRRLPQELVTVPVRDPARLADAADVWVEVAAVRSALDGRGRVLLRPSGTEPVVRVMVEAETADEASLCAARLAKAVRSALGPPAARG